MIKMVLSSDVLTTITNKVLEKIRKEITIQNGLDSLNDYLESIHCSEFVANYNTSISQREAKIAVFGDAQVGLNVLQMVAKKMGINPSRIEFHLDYEKNERFDFSKFKDSTIYSDIIFGPASHKAVGIDGYSSAIAMMETESEHYPKIIKAIVNNELKITKNSFKEALNNTQYLMMLY